MSVRSEVFSLFKEVAAEQQRRLAPLSNGLGLLETGLDSLCFAIVVVRMGRQPHLAARPADGARRRGRRRRDRPRRRRAPRSLGCGHVTRGRSDYAVPADARR